MNKTVYTLLLPLLIALALSFAVASAYTVTNDSKIICVKHKEVINVADMKIMVVTDVENKKYEVANSTVLDRKDAAEDYKAIKVGQCYTSRLQGFNFPSVSMFQNILHPTPVAQATR